MKLFLLIIPMLLTGCLATPVKQKFPDVPPELLVACPELKTIDPTNKLSDVVKVVAENYGRYHECSIKSDVWVEWYNMQKNIFESVK